MANYDREYFFDINEYIDENVLPVYKKHIIRRERFQVFMGGGGSGKSHFVSRSLVMKNFVYDEPMKILVVRNIKEDNRGSTFAEIKKAIEELGFTEFYKINKTTMDIACTRNGASFVFRGLDDFERIKSIQGITTIWVEEASEISEDALNQLNLRLRAHTKMYPNQFFITFNPISNRHWLKTRFFDKDDEDVFTLKTTYKDNHMLPEDNVKELEKLKFSSPYYYQVYALGEWGTVGESVFNRELLEKQKDVIFRQVFKRGRFKFDYVDQMIVPESIEFVLDSSGPISIFSEPQDNMPYVCGADTAGTGIDNFAAIVLNNYNGEMVAQYYGANATEKEFTDQLYCLGMWYNEAMLDPETNYSTYPALELARMEYPTLYKREVIGTNDGSRQENRYGFVTTKTNRNSILSLVDQYVRENPEYIHSYELLDEMSSFILVETKSKSRKAAMRQEAAKGAHDDLIMAFGITLFTRDQWEKHPRPDRKPTWKQDPYNPLRLGHTEDDFYTIW